MQFSYAKIFIYVLTFIAYSYSGYGSSVIMYLKDALMTSELLFGDVFKNIVTIFKKFRSVNEIFNEAVDENCVFKCPNDVIPVQNKLYTPTTDGCGSLGLGISTEYLPHKEMELCCNAHDICYDTCNSDKELCDLDFKRCLYKYCDSYDKTIGSALIIKSCKTAANVLFAGVFTLSCKSYKEAQKRSCYCVPVKSSQSERGANNKYYKDNKQNYGWRNPNK